MLARFVKRRAAELYGAAKPWAHVVGFYAVFGVGMTVSLYNHSASVPDSIANEPVPTRVNAPCGDAAIAPLGCFDIKDRCATFAAQFVTGDQTAIAAAVAACRIEFQTADRSHI